MYIVSRRTRLADLRRGRARELREAGWTIREIAARLGVGERTVYGYLSGKPQSPASASPRRNRARMIEAGMAFYVRYDVAPSARAWHATKAREDGGVAWRRYLEGWIPCAARETGALAEGRVLRWPPPGHIAREFGSMERFRSQVRAELVRRARAGTPYTPVLPPKEQLDLARLKAKLLSGLSRLERRRGSVPGDLLAPTPDEHFAPSERVDPALPARPSVSTSDDGPLLAPRRAGRGFWAVVGDPGTGKTSLLWRMALSDVLERSAPTLVIERSDGVVAALVEAAGAARFADATRASSDEFVGLLAGHTALAVRSDDVQPRMTALLAATGILASGAHRSLSLILDDAEDLRDELILLLTTAGSHDFAVTAAWAAAGETVDHRLLLACDNLTAFRTTPYPAAAAVADALNKKQEEVVTRRR